jgi:hypothetical protein
VCLLTGAGPFKCCDVCPSGAQYEVSYVQILLASHGLPSLRFGP